MGRPLDRTAGVALADDATRDRLARELRSAVRDLAAAVEITADNGPHDGAAARRPADPDAERQLLWVDDRAAAFLATIGDYGQAAAEQTRSESQTRWETVHQQLTLDGQTAWGALWALWWDPGGQHGLCPALVRLATVLWLDRWRGEVEKEREAAKWVGVIRSEPFDHALAPVLSQRSYLSPTGDGRQLVLLFNAEGHEVGWFEGWVLDDIAEQGLKRLQSRPFMRLACMGADTIARQQAMGYQSPLITEFPGKTALAQLLGVNVTELDELLDAAQRYQARITAADGGRRWEVRGIFTMAGGDSAAPGRTASLVLQWNVGLFAGGDGLKTPMPDPNAPWPTLGPRARAKGDFAHMLVHRELSEGSRLLAKNGHAPIHWERIRKRAGLTRPTMDKFREFELKGQEEHGAWILEPVPGRFRLADELRHAFLVKQGQRRDWQSARGKRRAAKAEREAGRFAKGPKQGDSSTGGK